MVEKIEVKKTPEGYEQVITITMTEEEKKKTFDILKKNLEKINKDIEQTNRLEDILEEEKRKLKHLKEEKELTIKNFDKWLREEIIKKKKNAAKEKLTIQQQLNNWDDFAEQHLETVKKNTLGILHSMQEVKEQHLIKYEAFK